MLTIVIHEMKRITNLILGLWLCLAVTAQENDTTLMRELGVRSMEKHLYVHAFQNKRDTCTFFSQEFDERQRSIKEHTDMSCYGYPNISETERSYASDTSWFETTYSDGLPVGQTKIRTDASGKPLYVKVWMLEQNDSSETWITYVGDRGKMADSSASLTLSGGDSSWMRTVARFNSDNKPTEIIRFTDEQNILAEDLFEYDSKGRLLSVSNTMHGEQPYFMQTYYSYDQQDRVVETSNSSNQRQVYLYLENGLLSNMLSYNPKGELEAEIIYTYTYK